MGENAPYAEEFLKNLMRNPPKERTERGAVHHQVWIHGLTQIFVCAGFQTRTGVATKVLETIVADGRYNIEGVEVSTVGTSWQSLWLQVFRAERDPFTEASIAAAAQLAAKLKSLDFEPGIQILPTRSAHLRSVCNLNCNTLLGLTNLLDAKRIQLKRLRQTFDMATGKAGISLEVFYREDWVPDLKAELDPLDIKLTVVE